ncbi:hypothetical protein [Microbacterium sp. PM5]|uniref:hypothetical protein n=1 Tax=Microbacterium sp. PM5 TaxID=2014534 RepID=UPI0013AF9DCA|nr:hypothetical protein [Microbacterium sp. PM5]
MAIHDAPQRDALMLGIEFVMASSRVGAWMYSFLLLCSGLACATLFSIGVVRGDYLQAAWAVAVLGFAATLVYQLRIKPRKIVQRVAHKATESGQLALALAAVATFPYGPDDRRGMRDDGASVLYADRSRLRIVDRHGATLVDLPSDQIVSVGSVRFLPLPGHARAVRVADVQGRTWDAYLIGGGVGLFFPPKDCRVDEATRAAASILELGDDGDISSAEN